MFDPPFRFDWKARPRTGLSRSKLPCFFREPALPISTAKDSACTVRQSALVSLHSGAIYRTSFRSNRLCREWRRRPWPAARCCTASLSAADPDSPVCNANGAVYCRGVNVFEGGDRILRGVGHYRLPLRCQTIMIVNLPINGSSTSSLIICSILLSASTGRPGHNRAFPIRSSRCFFREPALPISTAKDSACTVRQSALVSLYRRTDIPAN